MIYTRKPTPTQQEHSNSFVLSRAAILFAPFVRERSVRHTLGDGLAT